MGRAQELWDRLVHVWQTGEVDEIPELYNSEAIYYEPYNPPHRGNLLTQAYVKDYLVGKDDLKIEVERAFERADGSGIAVEWNLSYSANGRTWNNLPRVSVIDLDEDGTIIYHRDYF